MASKPSLARPGLAPHKRKIANSRSNQWQANPKQELFLDYYLDVNSETFANAYQSAIKAGYSEAYANEITAPTNKQEWLRQNPRLNNYELEHIQQKLVQWVEAQDSRYADKIKAIELLAKLKGLLIERKQVASVVKVELGKANATIDATGTEQT